MVRAGSRLSVATWAVCTNTKEPGDGSAQTGHRTCPTRRDGGSKATEAPLNRGFFATRSLTNKCAATPASSGSKASCRSALLALPLRPLTALGQEQESSSTDGQARSGGGLGTVKRQGTILVLFFGLFTFLVLALAQWGSGSSCGWQFPKWFGCVLQDHESLAAGLIGAAGALFAAWIAWTAVQRQLEEQQRQV